MHCTKCGKEITGNFYDFKKLGIYCLECMTCSVCGKKAKENAVGEVMHLIGGRSVCQECARSRGMTKKICRRCGTILEDFYSLCPKCGLQLKITERYTVEMIIALLSIIGFLLMLWAFFFM